MRILLGIIGLLFPVELALAVTLTASSVTENFAPPLNTNTSCLANVSVVADGQERISATSSVAYCPQSSVPSNYEVTYTWSPAPDQLMTSLTVWANGGGIYSDGELQSFDLEVDYIDDTGSPATLLMPGVNIGDTLNIDDPKTVVLMSGGVPVSLAGVSDVRISNLGGATPEFAWREIFGEFDVVDNDLVTAKAITAGAGFPSVGDTVTFEITVTNNGTDDASGITLTDVLPAGLTPTIDNGTVSTGIYNSGDGTWIITNLAAVGGSATLTLEGVVDAGQEGNIITNSTTAADNLPNDETNTVGDVLSASIEIANPLLNVVKTTDQTGTVSQGTRIIYTYRITNVGNRPISDVSLVDSHNAAGPVPLPDNPALITDAPPAGDSADISGDNIWDLLAPEDVIEFQAFYDVLQADIDNLQ